jgi:hypothetical protein
MQTKTLEQTPLNAQIAVSTPRDIDYSAIVRVNAERKSRNGQTLTTNKGKVSLLTACIDTVRSQLGLPEYDDEGSKTRIGVEHVESIKSAIDSLLRLSVDSILLEAKETGANIRIRRNYLAPKFNEEKGTIGVDIKSSIATSKEQFTNSGNYRMGVVILIEASKKRLVSLETAAGTKNNEDSIAKCKRKIAKGESILATLNGATK